MRTFSKKDKAISKQKEKEQEQDSNQIQIKQSLLLSILSIPCYTQNKNDDHIKINENNINS
jgi:hypothetical protein